MSSPIDYRTTDIGHPNLPATIGLSHPPVGAVLSRVEATQVAELIERSKRPNTRTAYSSDLRQFALWVQSAKPELAAHIVGSDASGRPTVVAAVPVPAVLAYIAARKDTLAVPTVRRHVATLSAFHQLHGWANPAGDALVRAALVGLRREQQHQPRRAHALRAQQLRHIINDIARSEQGSPAAVRDRALLLVGWNGALRRSELANLTWGQVQTIEGGIVLRLVAAKTDTSDEGQTVALPQQLSRLHCPQTALVDWLRCCEQHGLGADWEHLPVFCEIPQGGTPRIGHKLSGRAVAEIVKRRAVRAGLDAYAITGHSLRAGLITEAHAQGVSDLDIMATSRHKSHKVFASYVRDTNAMRRAASKGLL
jgi:integrase